MSAHTPGPWGRAGNGCLIDIPVRAIDLENEGISISYINTASQHRREIAKANARLISAAPDLLAVVEKLCAIQGIGDVATWASEWVEARAAIAKATGQKGGAS